MWKTRIDRVPPPAFWADFVATVGDLFPLATLDRKTLEELYDLVLEQWRNGVQIHLIARQLCSCEDKKIVASPAAQAHLTRRRGLARGPRGAVPGVPFGPGELREPAPIARVQARLAQLQSKIERGTQGMEALARKAERSKSPEQRDAILAIMTDAQLALARLAVERQDAIDLLQSRSRGNRWETGARDAIERTTPRAPKAKEPKAPKAPTVKEPKAPTAAAAAKTPTTKAAKPAKAAKTPTAKAAKLPKPQQDNLFASEPKEAQLPGDTQSAASSRPKKARAAKPQKGAHANSPTLNPVPDDIGDAFVDELNEIAGKA